MGLQPTALEDYEPLTTDDLELLVNGLATIVHQVSAFLRVNEEHIDPAYDIICRKVRSITDYLFDCLFDPTFRGRQFQLRDVLGDIAMRCSAMSPQIECLTLKKLGNLGKNGMTSTFSESARFDISRATPEHADVILRLSEVVTRKMQRLDFFPFLDRVHPSPKSRALPLLHLLQEQLLDSWQGFTTQLSEAGSDIFITKLNDINVSPWGFDEGLRFLYCGKETFLMGDWAPEVSSDADYRASLVGDNDVRPARGHSKYLVREPKRASTGNSVAKAPVRPYRHLRKMFE